MEVPPLPGATAVYAYGASGTTSLCENLAAQTQNPAAWSRQYNRERNKLAGRMVKACKSIYKKMKFESRVNLVLDDVVLKVKNERSGEAIEKLSAVCINNLALVGQVEEMAVEFILGVRALSRFPYTFTIGLNGVRNFYFPTTDNMEAGGYEPKLFIEPGSMERVIREGGKLLNRVYIRMRN